jgi:hypothetical protein
MVGTTNTITGGRETEESGCVDIDGLRNGDVRARLADWLIAMEQLVDHIAVVGGWCVSNPAAFAAALAP